MVLHGVIVREDKSVRDYNVGGGPLFLSRPNLISGLVMTSITAMN